MRASIAIDTSEHAERVLEVAGQFLRQVHDPEIQLVTVVDDSEVHETIRLQARHELTPGGTWTGSAFRTREPLPKFVEDRTQALDRVNRQVQQWQESLVDRYLNGLPVAYDVVFSADIVAAIIDAATEFRADVIILGTRGRTGVQHILMGSTAEGVVRVADVPVTVIRTPSSSER